jgi:citrate lyase subunit alpha/citrate CoA-transferase
MKETVAMLNQQYVMPEGLTPYAGVTAKSPWLASEAKSASVKSAIRWKRRSVAPACKTA